MNRYYTETISVALAEKLKEKGMPMEIWNGTIQGMPYICMMEKSSFNWLDKVLGNTPSEVEVRYSIPTFGACFDWLIEQGLCIVIEPTRGYREWIACILDKTCRVTFQTWHEAADAAITKALELI